MVDKNKKTEPDKLSETTGSPAETTATSAPGDRPRGSRTGAVLGSVAILLSLGLAGSGYYFFKQLQQAQSGLGADQDKSDQFQLQLNKQLNNFQSEVGNLNQQIATLQSQLASKDTELTTSSAKLERYLGDQAKLYNERLEMTRTELQTGMTRIQRQLGKTRSDWLIADAEYLLSIANQRLHLVGDVKTTLLALEAADQRLHESADPAVYPVREQLIMEIDQLKKIREPDVVGIFIRLGQLQRKVGELPTYLPHAGQHLKEDSESLAAESEKLVDSGFEHLDEILATAWKDLKGVVTVRRSDQPVDEILAPEEAMLLKQGLVLKLEQARTALVQRNAEIYRASLDSVQIWLQRFFEQNDELTQVFADNVKQLQVFTAEIDYPDISGSLKKLRDITRLRVEMDKQLNDAKSGKGAE